LLRYPYFPR